MKVFKKEYGNVYAYYTDDIYEHALGKREKKKYPLKRYRKIIRVYLQVYFEDLYRNPFKVTYFFLAGRMKLAQQKWRGDYYIKWMWYYQPAWVTKIQVAIKKITRASKQNILSNLEKDLKEEIDVAELPSQTIEHKIHTKKKISFVDEYDFNSL